MATYIQCSRSIYSWGSGSWPVTSSPLRASWHRTFLAVFSTSLFSCLPSVSEHLQKESRRETGNQENRRAKECKFSCNSFASHIFSFFWLFILMNFHLFRGPRRVCFPFQPVVQGVPYHSQLTFRFHALQSKFGTGAEQTAQAPTLHLINDLAEGISAS